MAALPGLVAATDLPVRAFNSLPDNLTREAPSLRGCAALHSEPSEEIGLGKGLVPDLVAYAWIF